MRGRNDDEIIDFVDFTRDRPIDVRFIEYMPFQGNEWKENKMVPFDEMKRIIRKKYPGFQVLPNPQPNDTSKVCIFFNDVIFMLVLFENIYCNIACISTGLSCTRIRRSDWIYYVYEPTFL